MRVHFDLILGRNTTIVADIGNAGHLFQARNNHPFMQVGQLAAVQAVAFQHITENLARRRSQRIQPRHSVVWQFHIDQPLLHTLARPIVLYPVIENQYDGREAERILTTHHIQSRHPVHGTFNRNTDLLFYLLRCQSRHLGDDLHRRIGNVRIGVYR